MCSFQELSRSQDLKSTRLLNSDYSKKCCMEHRWAQTLSSLLPFKSEVKNPLEEVSRILKKDEQTLLGPLFQKVTGRASFLASFDPSNLHLKNN